VTCTHRSPHHGIALNLARLLNAVTIVVAVCVMIGIIINLVDGSNAIEICLAVYTLIFAVLIIMIELGRPAKLQATALFKFWPLRGAVYAYLGFVTADLANDKGGAEEVFGEITGELPRILPMAIAWQRCL
jgi:UDP-N-acetylmuramyl pentapeptide phosphotransferase/UDP-N-acetylglucosamine-1-phosphate transferase